MAVKKINLGRVRGNVDSGSVIEFTIPESYTEPVSGGKLFEITGNLVRGFRNVFDLLNHLQSLIDNIQSLINSSNTKIANNTSDITEINQKWDNISTTLLSKIYPVGSIYMSVSNTSPASFLGGTWTAWGTGRVPVGTDASQTEFNTVEKSGGEKAHTLITNEIPAHTHSFKYSSMMLAGGVDGSLDFIRQQTETGNVYTTSSTGSGNAHNNLQPYITCYMWKRTV